jgi:hypothetical protein
MATGPTLSAVEGLAAAGAELRAHGYTWPRVRERTGLSWQLPFPLSQLGEVDTPRLAEESRPPVDGLIRLLLLGDEIPSERLDAFAGAATREALVRAELLREHGATVSARALVLPRDDLLLACDWPWLDVPSRVTVPDPSSAFTAEHVAPLPGEPAGTAVDVGTGCGIIALVAARHFEHVIGIDTSRRAIVRSIRSRASRGTISRRGCARGQSTLAQLQDRGHTDATIRSVASAGLVYLERQVDYAARSSRCESPNSCQR